MRPEAELVLCAVQRGIRAEQTDDTLAALLQQNLDWEAVANLATRNGVLPLAYRRLSAIAEKRALPPPPQQLKTLFHVNAVRSLHLTAELSRLLKLLESSGVAAIPFKGPALAMLLHGDVTMRQYVDLDLFVRPKDVPRAAQLFTAAGYASQYDCSDPRKTRFFGAYENEFVSAQGLVTVDLHWDITPDSLPFGPSVERVWTRALQSEFNGVTTLSLALADLLHVLCLQGCRDGWDTLSSVASVAGLVERIPEERDWALLLEESQKYRTYRMVLLGLSLANRWLDAPLPPAIEGAASADKSLTTLAQKIGAGFFTRDGARRMIQQRMQQLVVPLRLIETNHGRWRYCFVHILRPTLRDWEFVCLPECLFPLYYVLRPARLLLKLVTEPFKRLRRLAHGAQ